MLYLVAKFGQLSQKIPHLTSSVVTKNEAFHHIQQPAAHSTILGITCADLRRDIARSFSNSKIKWASSGTPCEGSKNPLYSKNSLPIITSQRVAGRRKVLTSKRKSQATHPVQMQTIKSKSQTIRHWTASVRSMGKAATSILSHVSDDQILTLHATWHLVSQPVSNPNGRNMFVSNYHLVI